MLKNVFDTHDKSLQQDGQLQYEQQQEDAISPRPEWEDLDLEGRLHFLAYKKVKETCKACARIILVNVVIL